MGQREMKFPRANENIFDVGNYDWNPAEIDETRKQILKDTTTACANLLKALRIGIDHNTQGTAYRMAKMFVEEVFHGRYDMTPSATGFPNYNNIDQIYTIGPATIRSCCSYPFWGKHGLVSCPIRIPKCLAFPNFHGWLTGYLQGHKFRKKQRNSLPN